MPEMPDAVVINNATYRLPGDLHELNAAAAKALVDQAQSVETLEALAAAERANPKHEGGRVSVLREIEARAGVLAEAAEPEAETEPLIPADDPPEDEPAPPKPSRAEELVAREARARRERAVAEARATEERPRPDPRATGHKVEVHRFGRRRRR